MAFDGFIRVDETMVVIVDTHVFTENGAVSDADFLDGMHGATVVEEHIVADGDGSAQFSGELQSLTEMQRLAPTDGSAVNDPVQSFQ